jgi:hypothetical protein
MRPERSGGVVRGELSDADLERVTAGKEGGFGRKVLWAVYSSSGFYPGNNENWRSQG